MHRETLPDVDARSLVLWRRTELERIRNGSVTEPRVAASPRRHIVSIKENAATLASVLSRLLGPCGDGELWPQFQEALLPYPLNVH
jgi:hypothetical protein